ncbi:hypothetical protein QVD17_28836 [Tagetes erecta]|uniref:Uncharacterized protein n=1 Tax=Tagetes erecta TaxID=13708 RepID=A0AAD8KE17_TARER|nr:hypothetical protein QVD17_28836 [Tagetes erecta]
MSRYSEPFTFSASDNFSLEIISGNEHLGTQDDPIPIPSDNSPSYYPSERGTRENPIIISSEPNSPSYHPTPEPWGQGTNSVGSRTRAEYSPETDYMLGASDHSNWRFDTPPHQPIAPRSDSVGTRPRQSRVPRMSVRMPTERFSIPNVDPYLPLPYNIPPPPDYVRRYNPNISHDLINSTVYPPPQYTYPTYFPQSMHEHLDRINQENHELRDDNEEIHNRRRNTGRRIRNMGSYVITWGQEISQLGREMEED